MHVIKYEREFQCPIISNARVKSVFRKQKLDNLTFVIIETREIKLVRYIVTDNWQHKKLSTQTL